MALTPIDPETAARMQQDGALLVDIREASEYEQIHIPGSELLSLSTLDETELIAAPGQPVIFFCAVGGRTAAYANRLAAKAGDAEAYVMAGGIRAWLEAGLPVE